MATLTFYLPTVIFISLVGGFLPFLRELLQKALALLPSVLLGAVFFHMLPRPTEQVHRIEQRNPVRTREIQ